MATYTPLDAADLGTIGQRYGLTVTAWRPLPHGSANTNVWLATSRGDAVLTISEEADTTAVRELCVLLETLRAHGIRTSEVLHTVDGEPVTTLRGKPAVLKAFLPGRVEPALSPALLCELGAEVARLHRVPPPAFLLDRDPESLWRVGEVRDRAPESDLAGHLATALPGLRLGDAFPRGLVHGDVYFDNVLVASDRLAAIIDFEVAFAGPLVFDLGMAIVGTCLRDGAVSMPHAQALVAGYQAERPLRPDESAALPRATAYAALMIASWRFWKYDLEGADPARRGRYRPMLRAAETIRAIPPAHWPEALGPDGPPTLRPPPPDPMGTKNDRATTPGAAAAAAYVERLAPLGTTSKKMFGGHGLFSDGAMFGMVTSAGDLALKTDDATRARYEAAGSTRKGKMPYWLVPAAVAADDARLLAWAREAVGVAHAAT